MLDRTLNPVLFVADGALHDKARTFLSLEIHDDSTVMGRAPASPGNANHLMGPLLGEVRLANREIGVPREGAP